MALFGGILKKVGGFLKKALPIAAIALMVIPGGQAFGAALLAKGSALLGPAVSGFLAKAPVAGLVKGFTSQFANLGSLSSGGFMGMAQQFLGGAKGGAGIASFAGMISPFFQQQPSNDIERQLQERNRVNYGQLFAQNMARTYSA
jgi:hypothetical protein